jgi:hypothetical protein
VANEQFEDFLLTVFDSPLSGEVVYFGAVYARALCNEAFDQFDIAVADGHLKALVGWRFLCRHMLQYGAVGWEKSLPKSLPKTLPTTPE